jgi:tetrapyrrole methylase family protein/MazG family protein
VANLLEEGIHVQSFDEIYETSSTFEEVYLRIAETVVSKATCGDVVYAVPGHPLVGESSVQVLISEAEKKGLAYKILGSESFIEACLESLRLNLDEGLKIINALSMDKVKPSKDVGNLVYQVYDKCIASDVKLSLMEQYPDEFEIAIIRGEGLPEQRVQWLPLYLLDRQKFDHLTTLYIPPFNKSSKEE